MSTGVLQNSRKAFLYRYALRTAARVNNAARAINGTFGVTLNAVPQSIDMLSAQEQVVGCLSTPVNGMAALVITWKLIAEVFLVVD